MPLLFFIWTWFLKILTKDTELTVFPKVVAKLANIHLALSRLTTYRCYTLFSLTGSSSCQSVGKSDITKTAVILQFGLVWLPGLLKLLGSRQVWKVPSSHSPPCCPKRLVQIRLSSATQGMRTRIWQFQGMIKYFLVPQWLLAAVLVSHLPLSCWSGPEHDPAWASQSITARWMTCHPYPIYYFFFHYTLSYTCIHSSPAYIEYIHVNIEYLCMRAKWMNVCVIYNNILYVCVIYKNEHNI